MVLLLALGTRCSAFLCALSNSMSPTEQKETYVSYLKFFSLLFSICYLLAVLSTVACGLKKAEKVSGAYFVFLRSLPSFVLASRMVVVGLYPEIEEESPIIFWPFEAPSTSSFRTCKYFVIMHSGITSFLAWLGQRRQSAEKARNISGSKTRPYTSVFTPEAW